MLREYPARQVEGDYARRWFVDDYFDLYFWFEPDGVTPHGFQLCYDKHRNEHAITWRPHSALTHHRIDGGERRPGDDRAPVLLLNGVLQADRVIREFDARSQQLPPELRDFIRQRLTATRAEDSAELAQS